jgi:hypothetical protein
VGAGVAREVGEVALPDGVRKTQLYQNLVDATLRWLILPDDYLTRRAAGNALEVLGIVAFRASPVWVLAALAEEYPATKTPRTPSAAASPFALWRTRCYVPGSKRYPISRMVWI